MSSSYIGTVRLEPVTPLESALGPVNMFANISNELSSSADIAGKAVVEKYSPVCVQVQSDSPQSSRYSAGREDGIGTRTAPFHEFVYTVVLETRGDDVLALRVTRGSNGPDQNYLVAFALRCGVFDTSVFNTSVFQRPGSLSWGLAWRLFTYALHHCVLSY